MASVGMSTRPCLFFCVWRFLLCHEINKILTWVFSNIPLWKLCINKETWRIVFDVSEGSKSNTTSITTETNGMSRPFVAVVTCNRIILNRRIRPKLQQLHYYLFNVLKSCLSSFRLPQQLQLLHVTLLEYYLKLSQPCPSACVQNLNLKACSSIEVPWN